LFIILPDNFILSFSLKKIFLWRAASWVARFFIFIFLLFRNIPKWVLLPELFGSVTHFKKQDKKKNPQ